MKMACLEDVPVSLASSGAQARETARAGAPPLPPKHGPDVARARARVRRAGALLLATCCAVLIALAGVVLDSGEGWGAVLRPSALAWLVVMGVFAGVTAAKKRRWKPPQSRRFARGDAYGAARQRLDCGVFSAALPPE